MKDIWDYTGATLKTVNGTVISWNTIIAALKTSIDVYRHTRGTGLSEEELDDLFQRSAKKTITCILSFDSRKSKIETWLNIVVKSCASDMYKERMRFRSAFVSDDIMMYENMADSCDSHEEESSDIEQLIWNRINSFKGYDRAILHLSALGMSSAEIAKRLNLPLEAVYVKRCRARVRLAKDLSRYGISV